MSVTIAESIYQEGHQVGALGHARASLLKQGRKRFGPADETTEARMKAIDDIERIDRMIDRVLEVASWDELLSVE